MSENPTYKNWKAVTEADFVSLFIKTWFAYISTLRAMFVVNPKNISAFDTLDSVLNADIFSLLKEYWGYPKFCVNENRHNIM